MSERAIHKSRLHLALAILAGLLSAGPALADTAASGFFVRGETDSLQAAATLLREVLQSVQDVYVDQIPLEELVDAALGGIEAHLDSHTRLLTPEEYLSLRSRTGAAVGVGLSFDVSRTIPRVTEVTAGSSAEAAGMRPGDQVLAIDGGPTEGQSEAELRKNLRGPEGSKVRLEVVSPREAARTLELTRTLVREAPLDTLRIDGGRIGYVRLRRFARHCSISLEEILRTWAERKIEGLIIDLRGNPGGYLDEGILAADLFLPLGDPIVTTFGRLAEENGAMVSERTPLLLCVPKAILVDSLTASSAEIFAGALKGRPDVRILGEATYGKRSIQRIRPLSGGGAFKVTSAYFYTPADGSEEATPLRSEPGVSQANGILEGDGSAARGRHERLEPDLALVRPRMPEPWSWIERAGLIARFLQEKSLTPADRAAIPFWAGGEAPKDWNRSHPPDEGFDRWSARLVEHLARWGAVVDQPAGGAPGPLRRHWLADWAAERWGAEATDRARVELDPWVTRAVRAVRAQEPLLTAQDPTP